METKKIEQPRKYPLFHRILHALIALGVLYQFTKVLGRAPEGSAIAEFYSTLPNWHGNVGITVMLLVLIKLAFIGYKKLTGGENTIYNIKRSTPIVVGHIFLNVTLIAVPVTAACYIISKGYPLRAFGMVLVAGGQELPAAMASLFSFLGSLHSPFALAMIVLVLGHIAMAIKHIATKDKELVSML